MNEIATDKFVAVVETLGGSIQRSAEMIAASTNLEAFQPDTEFAELSTRNEIDNRRSEMQAFGITLELIEQEMMDQTRLLGDILGVNKETLNFMKSEEAEAEREARQESVSGDTATDGEPKDDSKKGMSFGNLMPKSVGGVFKSLGQGLLVAAFIRYLPDFIDGFVSTFFDNEEGSLTDEASQSGFWSKVVDFIFSKPELIAAVGTAIFGLKFGFLSALAIAGAAKLKEYIEDKGTKLFGEDIDLGENFVGFASLGIAALGYAMFKAAKTAVLRGLAVAGSAALGPVINAIKSDKPPAPADEPDADKPKAKPATGPLDPKEKAKLDNMSDKKLEKAGIKRVNEGTADKPKIRYRASNGRYISGRDALEKIKGGALESAAKKFKGFGKLVKVLGPLGTAVGVGLTLFEIAEVLNNDDMPLQEKQKTVTGLMGGLLGGIGGAAVGAVIGQLAIPVPILGGLAGGTAGALLGTFGGDYIAREMITPYIFGNPNNFNGNSVTADEIPNLTPDQVQQAEQAMGDLPALPSGISASPSQTPSAAPGASLMMQSAANMPSITASSTVASTGVSAPSMLQSAGKSTALEKQALEASTSASGGGANVINNTGGNVQNNTSVGGSSVTYNITSSPSKVLTNSIPVPMSASAWG